MKQAKWLAAGVLVGSLALSMTACGGGSSAATDGQSKPKVGVILKTTNAYFNAMSEGIAAMPKDDIEFLGVDAPGNGVDAQPQITAIEGMVTRGADAIVVAPIGPQVQPALDRAVSQGVKIVLVNDDLGGWKGASSYVGTDNYAGASQAGKYLAEQLKNKGTLAIMSGIPGVPALDARVNGVLDALKGTDIKVVNTLATECDQTKGVNVMQAFAASNPDVDAIYSACGPPVLGAIEARKKSDPFKPGLLLVGFDALPDEANAILAGTETASIAQFPKKMGTTAVTTAAAAARGDKFEPRIDTGTEVVTKDTAQKFTTFQ
ncbi:sugar ABC transporter substrate-binding protein [Pseudarthrobacter sp. NIBRBAC000502772]|uniref:sugar ABC transporter substrate-binding protein n=1 Tax=Pseudarthrobacter sp. NIBRBAC000502772 TaxID=2590775 RepID=UPI00143CE0C7|nr:sugar ABC transporter substrate-binding protein [Pseudarthrobacter sp. NIBRBAC000502772]